MAKLRGSGRDLAWVKEVTSGVTPDSPVFQKMRTTGDSFNLTRDSYTSEELRSDRAVTDVKLGNKQASGSIDYELSYDNFDSFMASVLESDGALTKAGDSIKNGVKMTSYTIEKSWPSANVYQWYTGMYPNTMSLSIASNSQITGSIAFIGTGYTAGDAPVASSTYEASTVGGLFDSYNGVLKEGGVTIGYVSSLSLDISNGLEALFALFNENVSDVIDGRCSISGSLVVYFQDATLFDKFADETESTLEFTLTSGTTNGYTFKLPRIKYTSADMPVSGEGAVMLTLPFTALHDETEQCTIEIVRN